MIRRLFIAALAALLLISTNAQAQALTGPQLTALKADILAQPDLSVLPNDPNGNSEIARLYTLPASPEFWAWRTRVSRDEYTQETGPEGTTFNWTATGYITRSVGERDAWRDMFGVDDSVNPSLANVRQAFADIFSGGTAPAPANRAHLLAVSRRRANRLERLLATGTGSTASPGSFTFEGTVGHLDIATARNLP